MRENLQSVDTTWVLVQMYANVSWLSSASAMGKLKLCEQNKMKIVYGIESYEM